jgi:hypothetical protein
MAPPLESVRSGGEEKTKEIKKRKFFFLTPMPQNNCI